eukprot:3519062-Rhodomonas_salina.1
MKFCIYIILAAAVGLARGFETTWYKAADCNETTKVWTQKETGKCQTTTDLLESQEEISMHGITYEDVRKLPVGIRIWEGGECGSNRWAKKGEAACEWNECCGGDGPLSDLYFKSDAGPRPTISAFITVLPLVVAAHRLVSVSTLH